MTHAATADAVPVADSTVTGTSRAREAVTRPERLGVHLVRDGVDVVVSAPNAERVWLCLLEASNGVGELREERVELLPAQHGRWHAHVPGVRAGQRYGFRADGPWDPVHGLRHNPAQLALDPYARGIVGGVRLGPEVYAHVTGEDLRPTHDDGPDPRDSAPFVPHGVVLEEHRGSEHRRPRTWWSRTVVYEAHVKGLTMRLPGVPEHLRGTYAGLAHPVTVAHLRELGVTAVELLPIHAKASEPALVQRGATNYWGYSTLSFFAPEPSYATAAAQAAGAAAVLEEVTGMVHLLHEAGIEVLLDVVYNHTCEGGPDGPALSWRALDDRYYLRDPAGRYLDTTGTGNSLDFRDPRVVQLALDSLRYWTEVVGVDGFRFDLAVTLARRGASVDMDHPFLVALATDPVLSGAKLIAEPWDLGNDGWQTGRFPAPMAEWNDRYRDCVRTFWVSDVAALHDGGRGHDLRELATRIAGSADLFAHPSSGTVVPGGRGPVASVSYVTAHDGFTLADLVSYDRKHNEENGEDDRDGSDHNRSWNHGVEGPTEDAAVLARRRRTQRNVLGTMMLSAGVPMLTAGDEIARTQRGNNNAYCLDDERVWVDWELRPDQQDLLATVQHLSRLRRENPVLRPWRFRHPQEARAGVPTLTWYDGDGEAMTLDAWHDADRRVLQMHRLALTTDGSPARDALVVINGGIADAHVRLADVGAVELVWDSAWERPGEGAPSGEGAASGGSRTSVPGPSLRLYLSRD